MNNNLLIVENSVKSSDIDDIDFEDSIFLMKEEDYLENEQDSDGEKDNVEYLENKIDSNEPSFNTKKNIINHKINVKLTYIKNV